MYGTCPFLTHCTYHRVSSAETRKPVCIMSVVQLYYTSHQVLSSEFRNPKPETQKYVCNMSIFHLLHKSLSFKCQNPKLETRRATCSLFIYITQIIEFRVPSAETQSLRPENMYTTCPFFTHCTNHRVSSAKTRNSKPGMQHVHFSFTLHKSSSAECRVLSAENRSPRPENMYTTCPFFTHCTNHQVLSAET